MRVIKWIIAIGTAVVLMACQPMKSVDEGWCKAPNKAAVQ